MSRTLDTIRNIKLYQSRSGYRFTIDSVLLADYVRKVKPHNIVDVGSGNGIVGILLAKKYISSRVAMIEIQKGLHDLSVRNIALNRLKSRITPYNIDIRDIEDRSALKEHSFDIAVSNPPFRIPRSGKISPYNEKAIARHEIMISLDRLIGGIACLLRPKGSAYLIYHPERLVDLFDQMREKGIEPKRARFIHPNDHVEAKMVLVEGVKGARTSVKIEKPLFIYNKDNEYTEEVQEILK
ncbi:MAG: methyltransferase [Thermodesulfovibrionales bacterium]